jgi:uncharacterized protein
VSLRAIKTPGLTFEAVHPAPPVAPLRSDIAAFVGPTRRGPIGVPVRVEGWREYRRIFGGLARDFDTPHAVCGYFQNGGEVAWIVRVAAPGARVSRALWDTQELGAIAADELEVSAGSPGAWSNGGRVTFTYRGRTTSGRATVDVEIRTSDEREDLRALPAGDLQAALSAATPLIRLDVRRPRSPRQAGRAQAREVVTLDQAGESRAPGSAAYLAGLAALGDVPEAALVAFPNLHEDLAASAASEVLRAAAEQAELLRDRLVLVDLPPHPEQRRWQVDEILGWVEQTLGRGDDDRTGRVAYWRAAALYHPRVRVSDPLGGTARPVRAVAPSGHVAGTISQLDRERGAHSTPANAPFVGVVDLEEEYENDEHALLNEAGVDLLRCVPSLGFSVWGGRTLDRRDRFVAHQRLLHRLVRAIRRVAEPLAFETNGPPLWFAFVRAITAVLLEAWRAGALAGARPEEAFDVTCDESTNPPEEREQGRCVCSVQFAPAVPMEFILIRVALSRDGSLEVLS